ncbi:MAG: glycosyltransferase [Bradymonadaceae bacterium]
MSISPGIERYLGRHAELGDDRLDAPSANLRLVVVIPAMAESDYLGDVLDSLEGGSERLDEAEVLVVVNRPEDAPEKIAQDNAQTLELLDDRTHRLPVFAIDRVFAAKSAGVGRARRVGMDLALSRLAGADCSEDGLIACLDADSPVAPGYIDTLLTAFAREDASMLAGVCPFRHPLPEDEAAAEAIVAYETWLRYRELSIRRAGSPYAFQTLGSCIVTRAAGYALADGMPTKQAGEDFHFLNKLVKVGGPGSVRPLEGVLVQPSPRQSSRVPFGTGPAMRHCLNHGLDHYRIVPPAHIFEELARFFDALGGGDEFEAAGPTVRGYMESIGGWRVLDKLGANHSDQERFVRAFHGWFDGLRVLQYARFGEEMHGGQPIEDAMKIPENDALPA